MSTPCPVCQAVNPPGVAQCQQCGAQLAAASTSAGPSAAGVQFELRSADGAAYPLTATSVLIGRASGCDIQLAEQSVSGRHARLFYQGRQWLLEDLGSTNGTLINNAPLSPQQPTRVQAGDTIVLGAWRCVLQWVGASAPQYTPTVQIRPAQPAGVRPPPALPPAHPGVPAQAYTPPAPAPGRIGALARPFSRIGWPWAGRKRTPGTPPLPPGAVAVGIVTSAMPDEPMQPGWNAGKFLVKLAFWLLIIGGLAVVGMANWVWLALLSLPVLVLLWLLRSVGLFLMPFGMFSLFGRGQGQSPADAGPRGFHWSVSDNQSGQVVSGRLVRRRRAGGHLTQGDEVAVYGRVNRSNLVEAGAIIVTRHAGGPTWVRIDGQRPWPLWVGLAAFLVAAAILSWLALVLNVLALR